MYNQFRGNPHPWWKVAVLVLTLLLSACQPIQRPAETQDAAAQPIVIEITADGMNVPEEMPSGIVTVTFKNSSDKPANADVGWMVEGSTVADFEKAAQAEDFMTLMKIAIPGGGAVLEPGESKDATFEVKAGELIVINSSETGLEVKTSKATTASTMTAPVADYKLELADFAFIMPDEIAAGKHLWEVRNTGKQIHEIAILTLNDGVTVEDVIKMASSQEPPSGPPPYEQIPSYVFVGSGATSWVEIDIPAGEYTVICFLPNTDDEAMSPHAAHGMVRTLVVK